MVSPNTWTTALRALHRLRVSARDERTLQDAIGALFPDARREAVLDEKGRDRVDFLVPKGIAIEVKVGGGLAEVTRQLHRYAQHAQVSALVLVTTRALHLGVPRQLNGKPVDVVHVTGGAF